MKWNLFTRRKKVNRLYTKHFVHDDLVTVTPHKKWSLSLKKFFVLFSDMNLNRQTNEGPIYFRRFKNYETESVQKLLIENDFDIERETFSWTFVCKSILIKPLWNKDEDNIKDNKYYFEVANTVLLRLVIRCWWQWLANFTTKFKHNSRYFDKIEVPCKVGIDFYYTCSTINRFDRWLQKT